MGIREFWQRLTSRKVLSAIERKHAKEAKRRGVPLERYMQALAILDKIHAKDAGSPARSPKRSTGGFSLKPHQKMDPKRAQAIVDNLNLNVVLRDLELNPPPTPSAPSSTPPKDSALEAALRAEAKALYPELSDETIRELIESLSCQHWPVPAGHGAG